MTFLTADIPGTGGSIKEVPEDFVVTEIPRYEPCGEGEHLFVEIEKRGLTTLEALRRLAEALEAPERDMGYAGLKDTQGITRQTVSIPRVDPEQVLALDLPKLRVLSAVRHRNKLKPGHLAGNRFAVRIRGVAEGAGDLARRTLDILASRGVPNRFGEQRYGSQGNTHVIGGALLREDWQGVVDAIIGDPAAVRDERWRAAIEAYRRGDLEESARLFPGHCRTEREVVRRLLQRPGAFDRAVHALHPRLKTLYFSAWQSALFDRVLDRRMECLDRVVEGDLAYRHDNGACFLVEDAAAEAPRAQRLEISPSGPLFGSRMTAPRGEPGALEETVLREEGVEPGRLGRAKLDGERRPLRVPLGDYRVEAEAEDLILHFPLPRGSYATAVLREVMKTEPA